MIRAMPHAGSARARISSIRRKPSTSDMKRVVPVIVAGVEVDVRDLVRPVRQRAPPPCMAPPHATARLRPSGSLKPKPKPPPGAVHSCGASTATPLARTRACSAATASRSAASNTTRRIAGRVAAMQAQDMVMRPGAAEIARAPRRVDRRRASTRGIERRGLVERADIDRDAADAASRELSSAYCGSMPSSCVVVAQSASWLLRNSAACSGEPAPLRIELEAELRRKLAHLRVARRLVDRAR